MKKIQIAIASPSFSRNQTLRSKLKATAAPHRLAFCQSTTELKGKELIFFLEQSTCAIIGKEKINRELLSNSPKLKFISKYGVGTDNIDFEACDKFGVKVFTQEGTNSLSVAELCLNLMLSCLRKTALADRRVREGHWNKYIGRQLTGLTVGIIGCGHVGTELIRLLEPFRCKLLLNDIKDISELCEKTRGQETSLEELLSTCDIISLHVPLTKLTKDIINTDSLQKMQKNAILINTSRGKVVKQKDLLRALNYGTIAAAALDVFEEEPLLPGSPLFQFDNLVISTHIGGSTQESILAMGQGAIDGVETYLRANQLKYLDFFRK